MQKSLKKNEANILLEEDIYRKQIMLNHGVLGKDVVPKYDTGVEK